MDVAKLDTMLDLLEAALYHNEYEEFGNRVRKLKGKSLTTVIDELTDIEETPRLAYPIWSAIAILKSCIAGKRKEEDFVRACWKLQGLI
jgi:hypothetical protein